MTANSFLVGVPKTFIDQEADFSIGAGELDVLDDTPGVEYEHYDEHLAGYDAVLIAGFPITRETFASSDRLGAVALLGVGFDHVDLAACTEAGAVVFNSPDGVRRPMAQATLALLLALSTRLLEKDRAVRSGGWRGGKADVGTGLPGRTLGLVGAGNIGAETLRMAAPLGMRYLAYDPYAEGALRDSLNVTYVDLPTLLRESDFVSIHTPLTDDTRGLIGEAELRLMKPGAYLINTARGGIVDQGALLQALRSGTIAGAGLDVVDPEPPPHDDPVRDLPNAIVTPHSLGETDDLLTGCTAQAVAGAIEVAHGRVPPNVVNRDVLDTAAFRTRLEGYRERRAHLSSG